jgi:hypothetical protein
MAAFIQRRRYLIAVIVVAFAVALLVGGRSAWRLSHRLTGPPPPRQTDVSTIAGWMTIPYVSRAYRVPEPELYDALGVAPQGHRTSTLDHLARETGRSSADVLEIVRGTVLAWQATHPGPAKPEAPKREVPSSRAPPQAAAS